MNSSFYTPFGPTSQFGEITRTMSPSIHDPMGTLKTSFPRSIEFSSMDAKAAASGNRYALAWLASTEVGERLDRDPRSGMWFSPGTRMSSFPNTDARQWLLGVPGPPRFRPYLAAACVTHAARRKRPDRQLRPAK